MKRPTVFIRVSLGGMDRGTLSIPSQSTLDYLYDYGPTRGPVTRKFHRERIERILMMLKQFDMNGRDIIDVGCGAGAYVLTLAERNHVFGLDLARDHLRRLHEFLKQNQLSENAHCIVGDAQNLPFREHAFDLAICSEVLEEVLRPRKVLQDMRYVLSNGGLAVFSMPNLVSRFWLRVKLHLIVRGGSEEARKHTGFSFYLQRRMIRKEGYQIIRTDGMLKPFYIVLAKVQPENRKPGLERYG